MGAADSSQKQVGEAIQQMDQVTQQNAALVEEVAAAASRLKGQARDLVSTAHCAQVTLARHEASPPTQTGLKTTRRIQRASNDTETRADRGRQSRTG